MIIKYSDEKKNSKTRVIFICDNCNCEDDRNMNSHLKMLSENIDFDKDYCKKCWTSIRQKTDNAKLRMSKSIKEMIKRDPDWKVRNSISKKGIINIGDSNGMKNEEAKLKVSTTRKELMKNESFRKSISEATKKAWKDGKFDGVSVGQSKWHTYTHSNGSTYTVQGTWELAFIKWLDENNMDFKCHRGRLSYEHQGELHSYYPDFFVTDWNCYVDIKNDYHYSIQKYKFEELEKEGHKIKIILKDELEKLIKYKL
jgi:hypothetical protein